MVEASLAAQLQFTFDDLEANRRGSLTEYQRRRLRLSVLRDTVIFAAGVILPLGILIVLISDPNSSSSPLVLLILLVIAGLFAYAIISLERAVSADLGGGVKVAAGNVELHDVGRSLYRLSIGEQSFQISRQTFAAFSNGRFYRLYYTPKLRMILAAELSDV